MTARTLDPEPGASLAGSLRETVAAVEAAGGRALAVQADLADPDDRARVVPAVAATLGPVDVLVNNAAAAFYRPTAEMPLKRRRLTFELNVEAPIDLTQAVLPAMRTRGAGWIVNISSATSKHLQGPPFDPGFKLGFTTTTYGASKAALERFTSGLAAELYGDRIAVNSLAPVAAVRTPGADTLVGDVLDANPAIVEPLELFVEAALVARYRGPRDHDRPDLLLASAARGARATSAEPGRHLSRRAAPSGVRSVDRRFGCVDRGGRCRHYELRSSRQGPAPIQSRWRAPGVSASPES